ncbi:MAG: serine hydrolase [Bacillota bacterium]
MAIDFARLEEFVLDKMAQTKLSAVSLAIVEGDQIIYQRGFGQRDLEKGLPATPATLYGIGSVTKSFTCLAIMQLQERGLLHVDDPVERYLPLTVRPMGEQVRIRHLMSHSSGLPGLAYLESLLRYKHGATDSYYPVGNLDDMLTFLNGAGEWAYAKPGERWFYLNEGYVLLGGIIEKLSGKPYATYIEEEILGPLGMDRTTFDGARFHADGDAAVPYAVDSDGRHLSRDYVWGQAQADGGMVSNTLDMARYISMYLDGGKGIVSPQSLAAMMTPQVPNPQLDVNTNEPVSGYGFGLSESDFYGRRLIGHSGMMYVCTAAMQFLPDQKLGAIVLANGTGYPMAQFASFALATALGEDPWAMLALSTEKTVSGLTGAYETYKGTYNCRIKRQGDFLMLALKNKHQDLVTPLVPLDLSNPANPRFYTLAGGRKMAVDFHCENGQVDLIYERYRFRRTGK